METTFTIESFPLLGAAVDIRPDGNALRVQGEAIKAHLQRMPAGHLLRAVRIFA